MLSTPPDFRQSIRTITQFSSLFPILQASYHGMGFLLGAEPEAPGAGSHVSVTTDAYVNRCIERSFYFQYRHGWHHISDVFQVEVFRHALRDVLPTIPAQRFVILEVAKIAPII